MNLHIKALTLLGACILLFLTSGCFDTTEDFTINPDGSGKVIHECLFQRMSFGAEKETPEEAMRSAVKEVLEKSKGVDAWRDVSYQLRDDGRIFFRGTALFKNLSKLHLHNQTMLEFTWKKYGDGTAVLGLNANTLTGADAVGSQKPSATAITNQLAPEAFSKKVREGRVKLQQAKPILSGYLANVKHATTFHLPGKISTSSNFVKEDSGALTLRFEGAKVLEIIEKLANDDEWCRQHRGTGFDNLQEKQTMSEDMNQYIFGSKGPVSATIKGVSSPLFDYVAEVEAAKKEFSKIENDLGVIAASLAPPAQGQPLKKLEVAGIKLITASDPNQNLRPFYSSEGYTMNLLMEFSGTIQSITDGTAVETAVADDGTSLLPDSWKGTLHSRQISKDKTKALVEFELMVPNRNVRGLKEVSGHVEYQVGGTKEVDLGFKELKVESKGTALGAKIKSLRERWNKDGSYEIDLFLDLRANEIKTLSLLVNGERTVLEQRGWSGVGKTLTMTFANKTVFPSNGQLVAEVYDTPQTFETPFELKNITLSGAQQ
jgi:hypothetical protein